MGVLADLVPNHVGIATPADSVWWWELLRDGRDAAHADAFDVDWAAGGRIRLPVLGDGPDELDELVLQDGTLRYHEHVFPIAEGTEGGSAREVHDRQHYELVNFRSADHELNYRRFFAVNSLAGIRVDLPEVFAASHVEVGYWLEQGWVDGLRIDHPDGLADPTRYLRDLATLTAGGYTLVEKILEPGEELPADWACAGTTGYDTLALIDRLFVDPAAETVLDALDARLRGGPSPVWPDLVHDTKREVADGILGSEIRRLARLVDDVPLGGRRARRAGRMLPGLPVLPAGGCRSPARRAGRCRPAPARPGRHACAAGRKGVRGRHRVLAAAAADDRGGDGQGRRGLRVLPLPAPHVADRGGWGPFGVRDLRRRVPSRPAASARGLAARNDHALHPRHEARRGRPGADLGALGDPGPLGRPGHLLDRTVSDSPTGRWRHCCSRPPSARGPSNGIGCTATRRRPQGRPGRRPGGSTPTRQFEARDARAGRRVLRRPE